MSNIMAVVEGSTEKLFIREVLAPWLWEKSSVRLTASTTGVGQQGGNKYGPAKNDMINHLKNPHFTVVTTFFDYYGLSSKWPGRDLAKLMPHPLKADTIEDAIFEDIKESLDNDLASRLRPYIQMHEFEALLYSETSALPTVMELPETEADFQTIRHKYLSPEEINDSTDTAPSKRIIKLYRNFDKTLHGIRAAKKITIETMLEHCPHFREWVKLLRSFGPGIH